MNLKTQVKPKKFLGQHFLTDENIAMKIVDSLVKIDKMYLKLVLAWAFLQNTC